MSQPNGITLAVDELNNGTNVNHVYTNYDRTTGRTTYIHSGHTPLLRDTLAFYRTPSKSNGNFKGVMKTSFKFSKDIEVEGIDGTTTLVSPIIIEGSFSVPLGATDAEILLMRQRAIALLDRDDLMVDLNSRQVI